MNSDYIMDQALNKNATIKISLLYNCLLIIEKSIQRGAFSVKELPQIVEVTEPLSRYVDKAITITTNQYSKKRNDDRQGSSENSELFKKYTQEITNRKIANKVAETNPFDNIHFDNNNMNNNMTGNINSNMNNNMTGNNDIGVIDFNNTRPVTTNEPQIDTRPSWLIPEDTRPKKDEIIIPNDRDYNKSHNRPF